MVVAVINSPIVKRARADMRGRLAGISLECQPGAVGFRNGAERPGHSKMEGC